MRYLEFPHLSREALAEMASWTTLRLARGLVDAGKVGPIQWEVPVLRGTVVDGDVTYEPELDLKSLTFVRNRCDCRSGRMGRVCEHALAICLRAKQEARAADEAPVVAVAAQSPGSSRQGGSIGTPADHVAAEPKPRNLQTVTIASDGEPLRLRLHIPPNFAEAIGRGFAVLRAELVISGKAKAPEKVFRGTRVKVDEATRKALLYLEDLCAGKLASVLQMKTAQLAMLSALAGEEVEWHDTKQAKSLSWSEFSNTYGRSIIPEPQSADLAAAAEPQVRRGSVPRSRSLGLPPERPSGRAIVAPQRVKLPDNWMVVDGSPKFLAILLRDRDHPCYRNCIDWLRAEGFRKEPSNGMWWLRDLHKVLNFLATKKTWLDKTYDPGYTDNFLQRTGAIVPVEVKTEIAPGNAGYTVRMDLESEGIDALQLRNAIMSGRHYVINGDRIHLIKQEDLDRMANATRSLGGDPNRVVTGAFEVAVSSAAMVDAEAILQDIDEEIALPDDWTSKSAAIREVGQLEEPPLSDDVRARFRSYQLLGTAWLWHLFRNELGGVLADEMGLGKTIQAIGLLLSWRTTAHPDAPPALLVLPAGLIGNWRRELRQWAPGLRAYVHHGINRISDWEQSQPADVWLTSYGTLRNDLELLQTREWAMVIADEAQHIKNRRTHAARGLRSLRAPSRFVLTGTPIENSIEDLRSLFAFCLPGYLGRIPADARGEERNWHERRHLEKAAPYILRRSKALVAKDLPEKIEQTIWCELTPEQEARYADIQRQSEQRMMDLAASGASENRLRFSLLTELLRLRQVCADPGLIDDQYPLDASSKYRAFRELLEEAIDGGHRILVFSQFVQLLHRLRTALDDEGIRYEYIDGSTRDRLAVCDRFNQDPQIAVCLISLKAGGTGLNLTGADTVVHFDPWWNPAVEDQATDRAHRIGQTRTVTSYKLVTERTVEEKVLALQIKKANLLRDLLDESAQQTAKVDIETLQSLLSRDAP